MCPTGSALSSQTRAKSNLRLAFDVLDADCDGRISREDLRTVYGGYSGMGKGSDEGEDVIGSMIMVADANRDGYVEYDEFEKILESRKSGKAKNARLSLMQDVFGVMDKDGDGKVGHEDLKSYLSSAGFDASEEDVNAMIKLGGGHENGGVTYEGLLKILAV